MTVSRANLDDAVEGDDLVQNLTFTDADGSPFDITGWTVWFTVKERAKDNTPLLSGTKTIHENPEKGVTIFEFDNTETAGIVGKTVYDIQVKDSGGHITTIAIGNMRFIDGVTDAV